MIESGRKKERKKDRKERKKKVRHKIDKDSGYELTGFMAAHNTRSE